MARGGGQSVTMAARWSVPPSHHASCGLILLNLLDLKTHLQPREVAERTLPGSGGRRVTASPFFPHCT